MPNREERCTFATPTGLNFSAKYWMYARQSKSVLHMVSPQENRSHPGSSRVTIKLLRHRSGTELHLLHEFPEASTRDEHVQGWRFQLSLFANVVANEMFAGAVNAVDAWFDIWGISDDRLREQTLRKCASAEISFRDLYSALDGVADVSAHIAAAQRFMPGIGIHRRGDVRHCQGIVLADWAAVGSDGRERTTGTSVFVFNPDSKIDSVTGFTNPSPAS